jgi:hypothetical protein
MIELAVCGDKFYASYWGTETLQFSRERIIIPRRGFRSSLRNYFPFTEHGDLFASSPKSSRQRRYPELDKSISDQFTVSHSFSSTLSSGLYRSHRTWPQLSGFPPKIYAFLICTTHAHGHHAHLISLHWIFLIRSTLRRMQIMDLVQLVFVALRGYVPQNRYVQRKHVERGISFFQ